MKARLTQAKQTPSLMVIGNVVSLAKRSNMEIVKTKRGYPAIWVGGGASRNTFEATIVLRGENLAPAVFHRTHGSRCNGNQSLVLLQTGDLIVTVYGRLPADPDNPDVHFRCVRIEGFTSDGAIRTVVDVNPYDIPDRVWAGCNIYHNRDGNYFCK